jgi:DNA-binding MarR family transcriptional regulator
MKEVQNYSAQFVSQLHAAYRTLSRFAEDALVDIASDDGHMLSYILKYGPCTVGTLADVFGVKGATLTGQLDRLEKRRLLKRQNNPGDRRSFLVSVTPKGRAQVYRIGEEVMRLEAKVRARVSDRDYKSFLKVIDAIRSLEQTGEPK